MASHIARRKFLATLGGAAAWPLAAHAQQPAMPVVGFVHPGTPDAWEHLVAVFRQGLRAAGYVEDRNVALKYRWAENQYDRFMW